MEPSDYFWLTVLIIYLTYHIVIYTRRWIKYRHTLPPFLILVTGDGTDDSMPPFNIFRLAIILGVLIVFFAIGVGAVIYYFNAFLNSVL